MAKKKRKPDKDRRNPHDLPDRRAMEGMMQELVAGLQGQANQDTPLGKAQALMYRAFEEPDEQRRVQLAKGALATPEEEPADPELLAELDAVADNPVESLDDVIRAWREDQDARLARP